MPPRGGWSPRRHGRTIRGASRTSPAPREFIFGGYAGGEPVLVTAQGTYYDLFLQGWGPGLSRRWSLEIPRVGEARGCAGSHMCAVVDINGDGIDEVLYGERCIELAAGRELLCAGAPAWHGHSDIVQPVLDRRTGQWSIFTCRESQPEAIPRVVMFDARGEQLWSDVDQGHMDMGWVARIGDGGQPVAMAIRVGAKTCGPDGRFHQRIDQFAWDAAEGRRIDLPFSTYRTIPVDLDGDGCHELVRGQPSGDGEVLDRLGRPVGSVGGAVAMASRFLDRPGEHLLSYHADGRLRLWADRNAQDTEAALDRWAHPFYRLNRALTGTGYNLVNLGGV